jgi:hypothetical protein
MEEKAACQKAFVGLWYWNYWSDASASCWQESPMGSSLSQKYELDLALQTFSEVPLKYTNYF